MKKFLQIIAFSSLSVLFMGCGGGGSDSDFTNRPQTLDGVILAIPGGAAFEFIRATGTDAAGSSGSETGTFFYTLTGDNIQQLPNQGGTTTDAIFPSSLESASYTYQAVNSDAAILTLTAFPEITSIIISLTGNDTDAPDTFFFGVASDGSVSFNTQMDLTFNNSGSFITGANATIAHSSSSTPNIDTVLSSANLALAPGNPFGSGPVPVNYNPTIDFSRPSRISLPSVDGTNFVFTDSISSTNNFTLQFLADNTPIFGSIEVGTAIQTINSTPTIPGADYEWELITGTDNASLTISSGAPAFDGNYTLTFSAPDTGTYIGNGSLSGLSGSFTVAQP